MSLSDSIKGSFDEAAHTLRAFVADETAMKNVERFADEIVRTFGRGGKLLAFGNGGSMCDAMHFVEEWTGRFRGNRSALPAIAFSDPSQLTCIANDFGFEEVFARQVEAHGSEGDLLLAISTSGNSPNVLRAVEVASRKKLTTIGLLGKGGGKVAAQVDVPIVVPDATTSDRIQELHIRIIHSVIEAAERELFPENYA